ncbi:hypothetical protein RRG08_018026 [Elysia crispata]|uniref:Uncharacterized protein n=1 Tax=Elysia crispata TaxID=231223 RepID=A0AAE0ZDE6_9GAST|nr:hypothetical protein RRG08_018026 [Elysia crispata]
MPIRRGAASPSLMYSDNVINSGAGATFDERGKPHKIATVRVCYCSWAGTSSRETTTSPDRGMPSPRMVVNQYRLDRSPYSSARRLPHCALAQITCEEATQHLEKFNVKIKRRC